MCELLGMSANVPTDICFSFTGLMQRGGRTGPHSDGWGVAFYEGKGIRLFHDPQPSSDSQIAALVQRYSIKSKTVICHIRQANRGRVCLENTHPFYRELWGKTWSFAHNGQLRGIKKKSLTFYKPVGTTDSELAFCWLLDQIRLKYPKPPRNAKTVWRFIHKLSLELSSLGVFNFLLSDSRYLFAHCGNNLHWLTRRAPFGNAQLIDAEMAIDFHEETTPNDIVTIIATKPLTNNEAWHKMASNELVVFENGLLQYQC